MTSVIVDGHNGGTHKAGVTAKGRLQTQGVADSSEVDAALTGRGFFTSTGKIVLGNDAEAMLLYIKNSSDKTLTIVSTRHYLGKSTGGSGDYNTIFHVNANSGTIITGSDPGDFAVSGAINTNLGLNASKPLLSQLA